MKSLKALDPIATMKSARQATTRLRRTKSIDRQTPPQDNLAPDKDSPSPSEHYISPLADSVPAFLQVMSRYPLLKATEEIELARQVRFLISAEEQRNGLTQELGRVPKPSELAARLTIEISELEQRCKQGRIAKRKMICSNLRLVVSIAHKYPNHKELLPDLIQEGVLGLNRAVEKFDPERGYKFSTYAYGWVHQCINQAIAHNCHTVRLPYQTVTKLNKLKQVICDFHKTSGRSPTEGELAKILEVSPRQLVALQRVRRRAISLNHTVGEEEKTELVDLLEDTSQLLEEQTAETLIHQEVRNILDEVLSSRERDIVFSLYGLFQSEPSPLDKVSSLYNLSEDRVLQLQTKAIQKLHRPQTAKRLQSLLRGL
ncbi:sigma-70 family RNA polymerase sigma factor [Phormidesmis sp. 146-33]